MEGTITMGINRSILGFFLILLVCGPLQAVPERTVGMIGAAKVDITPDCPVRMYGYDSRRTESEGVAGRLKASALAIGADQGDGPAVLLTVDCGAVPTEIRAEVLRRVQAKTPLKSERFMLCNAHSHSGPNLAGMALFSGEQYEHLARYKKELTDRLEEVVLKALASRKPGRLDWTQGSVGFAINRRVLKDGKWVNFGAAADAPVDHSLPLLRVTDIDGNLLAVVVNYACHNTTLGERIKEIHGDWAGCAQEYIEAEHPGTVAMIAIGCGADANPEPRNKGIELCQQHGRAMADEVNRLLAGPMKPVEPRVVARATSFDIPYEQPIPMDRLRQFAKTSLSGKFMLALLEKGEKTPVAETYDVASWTFGDDLAMVFLADEVVVDYALRMKREFDGSRLWISAYTNEVSYYIESKRLLKEGGYEVRESLSAVLTYGQPEHIDPPMEDRVIEAVRQLLPEGFRSPTSKPVNDR